MPPPPEERLPPPPAPSAGAAAEGLAMARDAFGRPVPAGPPAGEAPAEGPRRREAATESIGRRAGALSDELDFPEFVASLVHGTFDAIVDSSIRQMETFADLIAAVAKPLDQFMAENVTPNQARDHLAERYPQDVALASSADGPRLVPRGGDEAEPVSPAWLQDYGLAGQPLTAELLEGALLPRVREQVAAQRLQTLSTLVLMGMNRVVVKDGSINARLRFRAMAADRTMVDYAAGDEAGRHADGTEWGRRGARTYAAPVTKVATVGINAQADSELRAELFGEVRINFASETVPLDRFVDEARRRFVERHARGPQADRAGPGVPPPVPGAGERQP